MVLNGKCCPPCSTTVFGVASVAVCAAELRALVSANRLAKLRMMRLLGGNGAGFVCARIVLIVEASKS